METLMFMNYANKNNRRNCMKKIKKEYIVDVWIEDSPNENDQGRAGYFLADEERLEELDDYQLEQIIQYYYFDTGIIEEEDPEAWEQNTEVDLFNDKVDHYLYLSATTGLFTECTKEECEKWKLKKKVNNF